MPNFNDNEDEKKIPVVDAVDELGDDEDDLEIDSGDDNLDDDLENTDDDTESDDSSETKNVPLNKYVDEKKKRQTLEAETNALKLMLKEYQDKDQDNELIAYKNKLKEKFIDKEMDGDYAEMIAEEFAELKKAMKIGNAPIVDKESLEISTLKSEGSYYDNADVYSKEIKEKMKKFSISAKEAYNLIVDPISRNKEMQQRARAQKPETVTPKAGSSSNSSVNNNNALDRLSSEDKLAARELRKMGWDNAKILKNLGYK